MKRNPVFIFVPFLTFIPAALAQQPEEAFEAEEPAACICPKAGIWELTNLDGWMECNILNIKRTLKGKDRNKGVIWVLDDTCSTIFIEADERKREDVLFERGRDCLYFGFAPGREDGAEVLFEGAQKFETEEFLTGEFYLDMSGLGTDCHGYRPFEAEFVEPLSEKEYAKREKKMQEKLEATREVLIQYEDAIEKYLEKNDGGMALGGKSGLELRKPPERQ